MTDSYTKVNFTAAQDNYAKYGMQDYGEVRYLRSDIGATTTGISLYALRPGRRTGFAHRHKEVEEIYVVLRGGGRMRIDDEIIDIGAWDVVRVAPSSIREFEAGTDGMEILATGAHREGDGETVSDWWT